MLKITWNTYSVRRDLYKLGCKFSYEDKVWVCDDNKAVIDFCSQHNLDFQNYDKNIILDEKREVEQQNIRAKKKAEKYQERAEITEVKADETQISQHERDFLVLAELVKVWHHSEWRHRRLLDKCRRTMDKQMELYDKSKEYQRKADYWKNKHFLTEWEKQARKAQVKYIRSQAEYLWGKHYKVWDTYTWRHCSWIIQKINAKTVILDSWSKLQIAYSQDFDLYLKQANDEAKKND